MTSAPVANGDDVIQLFIFSKMSIFDKENATVNVKIHQLSHLNANLKMFFKYKCKINAFNANVLKYIQMQVKMQMTKFRMLFFEG